METTEQLLKAYKSDTILAAILRQLPQDKVGALVVQAAKDLGHRFEAEKLPLDRFWEIVALINWGEKHDSIETDEMKRHLMTTLPKEEVLGLEERVSEMKGTLCRAIKAWEKKTGNEIDAYGDSWDDLIAHIVGCGKEVFEATVKDPSKAADRYDTHNYQESFSYCLPWKDDYEKLDIGHYTKWAQGVYSDWDEEITPCEAKEEVLRWLFQVAKASDMETLLRAFEAYDEDKFLPLIRSLDLKGAHKTYGHSSVNEWAILNLVSDARKYLGVGNSSLKEGSLQG